MSTWAPEKILRRALEAGIACDLVTFSECVQFMYSHYDVFFLIDEYSKQNSAFILYCYSLGLVTLDPETSKYKTVDISATEALTLLPEERLEHDPQTTSTRNESSRSLATKPD